MAGISFIVDLMAKNLIETLLRQKGAGPKIAAVVMVIAAALLGVNLDQSDHQKSTSEPAASSPVAVEQGEPRSASVPVFQENGYEVLQNVRLVDHRNNDGDSFFVRANVREFELRLYFVDTAEKYLSDRHEDQRDRVREQARDFDLTVEETIELGLSAKSYVLGLLKQGDFTVYTKWDRVYDGERYYGFVEIPNPDGGAPIYMSELLVRKGLARIHTQGEPTPDGMSWRDYKDLLRGFEQQAKREKLGAWAL